MKVLISGASGLVGSALVDSLRRKGIKVVRLVRRHENVEEAQVRWDPAKGQLNPEDLRGIDAVVHLAGENIAAGRWNETRKRKIYDSRIQGTTLLAQALAQMESPPKALICASAIGYYGSRGDEVLTEVSALGKGFLAHTCRDWETASDPAEAKGIRVAHMRFGMILSPKGGALKAMYWPFRLGVAGNLGSGRQFMSWVALDDVVGAIEHVLLNEHLSGPVNVVSPNPVTNAEFTRVMHQEVTTVFSPGRIWAPPLPAPAVRMVFGEMGGSLLLASQRVKPVRLLETGYHFKYPDLKQALHGML